MDTDKYTLPKKAVKPHISDNSAVIKASNRFEPLDSPDTETGSIAGQLSEQYRSVKPPAIHIFGISNTYTFTRTLSSTCSIKPSISHGK